MKIFMRVSRPGEIFFNTDMSLKYFFEEERHDFYKKLTKLFFKS